jgi:hypothetical protein
MPSGANLAKAFRSGDVQGAFGRREPKVDGLATLATNGFALAPCERSVIGRTYHDLHLDAGLLEQADHPLGPRQSAQETDATTTKVVARHQPARDASAHDLGADMVVRPGKSLAPDRHEHVASPEQTGHRSSQIPARRECDGTSPGLRGIYGEKREGRAHGSSLQDAVQDEHIG